MRVLIIEDEPAIAGDIQRAVAEAGYVADVAVDGEEGWFRASTEDYDAVLIDLGLPKLDGLSVVRKLRDEGSIVPILVLTARGAWLQRVEGIDAGADDYSDQTVRDGGTARATGCLVASRGKARHAADRSRVPAHRHTPPPGDEQWQDSGAFSSRISTAEISCAPSGPCRPPE